MVTCICGDIQKRRGNWDITLLIAHVLPSSFYESSKNRTRERERKMNKTYKPSMFNYILDDDEKLILYNSFVGVKSILTVTKQNQEHVKSVLAPGMLIDNPGNIERCLIEHGLLVPTEENEKTKRDFLLSQIVNSNTLELVITVTEKCNFVCKYCSLDFAKGKMSVTVQDNIIEFVNKNIYRYKDMRVEWFGGEPLLCMDIIEKLSTSFIEICRKAHKGYSAGITTNGYLLSFDTFKTLYNNKVIAYQITLDGLKQEHDNQRCLANQKGTFDVILSNLLQIKSNTKSAFFRINIRTNFTKASVSNIDEYLRFFEEQFAGDDRFAFFVRAAGDWGGDRVKSFNGLLSQNEENTLVEKIYQNDPKIDFHMNYAFLEPGRTVCHAVRKNMFNIGCDGKIYKCDSSIDIACVGELRDGGNMEIDEYKVALWACGTRYMSPECEECFFSCSCIKGGCPLDIVKGYDPQKKRCSFEKENIDGLLKLFVKSQKTMLI